MRERLGGHLTGSQGQPTATQVWNCCVLVTTSPPQFRHGGGWVEEKRNPCLRKTAFLEVFP